MWGILQNLHYNRGSHGKKRLARKDYGLGKHSAIDEEGTGTTSDVPESVHSSLENSLVETKSTSPSLPPKNSMKSRLKSLITEEMYKRKGRHQRRTSYPTRAPLDQTNSVQHHESSSRVPPADNNQDSLHSDSPLPGSSRTDSCELCTTMLRLNYLKQSEVTQPVRDHTILRDKLVYAIEQTKCDSLQESKLFMDALDLLNLRKEVFLKILQDPNSSLAHQQNRRQAPSLTKSVSFPVSGPSARTDFKKDGYNNAMEDDNNYNHNNKHLVIVDKPRVLEISDVLKRRENNNKVLVLKRFKNLREKIKHVIRGHNRLKENKRIIMDAVHHMIPYGHNRMKEDKFGNYNKKKSHKRTLSLDESCSRYNQLVDISSNKEVKDHNNSSDKLTFRTGDKAIPRRFKRILSLPDLRTYSSIQIDDSSCASTSGTKVASNSVRLAEQKPFDVGLENNKFEGRAVSESASQENLFEVGSVFDESADSKTWETASSHDLNLESVSGSGPPLLDSGQVSEYESEDELGPVSLMSVDSKFPTEDDPSSTQYDPTRLNITTAPENNPIKKLYHDLRQQQLHVDTKNEAEFNYVRDVLELSGFTRDELLGKWHSADHPVDPMLFDEVEGECLVSQPECSGNEEYETCDHLRLFDLINEVLLDIHERSFYYWPAPLSTRSHVHRMPKGYRVLEEVWAEISWLLGLRPETDESIDDGVSRDLSKGDGWMSLQMDAEFVGLEVEELIFDDLLEEIVSTSILGVLLGRRYIVFGIGG